MYVLGHKITTTERGIGGHLSTLVLVRKCWGVSCLDFKLHFKVLTPFGDPFNSNSRFLLFDSWEFHKKERRGNRCVCEVSLVIYTIAPGVK